MTKRAGTKDAPLDTQADLFGAPATPRTKKPMRAKSGSTAPPLSRARATSGQLTPDSLLNVRQAAARLGLSKSTLDKMRGAGKGPRFVKSTDRAIRYDPKDLDAWIEGRRC